MKRMMNKKALEEEVGYIEEFYGFAMPDKIVNYAEKLQEYIESNFTKTVLSATARLLQTMIKLNKFYVELSLKTGKAQLEWTADETAIPIFRMPIKIDIFNLEGHYQDKITMKQIIDFYVQNHPKLKGKICKKK